MFENIKKIMVCPDSFKGSMSADEIACCIQENLSRINPDWEIFKFPLADGGEGTAEILRERLFQYEHETESFNALGEPLVTSYYSDKEAGSIFIESALTLGLPLIKPEMRDPMGANSYGLGKVIMEAMAAKPKEIIVSLGGSAVCDAGMGMLSALGFRFLDKEGLEIHPSGRNMNSIFDIKAPVDGNDWKKVRFTVLCDVNNPLFGSDGAAMVYAPQKGASEKEVIELDEGLRNFARVASLRGFARMHDSSSPGAGAAGGLGYAFRSFLNATLVRGIDFILDKTGFEKAIKDADLIITGEGKIDNQSLMGKVLDGVTARAKKFGVPVIAIGGIVNNHDAILSHGVKAVYQIANPDLPLSKNMTPLQTKLNLQNLFQNLP